MAGRIPARYRGERPSGAVVGEAEIGSGYSQVVQVAGGVHLGVHDVQPDLVALGKPGGKAVLHGAGDGCAVVRRGIGGGGFGAYAPVGNGDGERGGKVGGVARGSVIERVVAGVGCCQHQEQEQHRGPV